MRVTRGRQVNKAFMHAPNTAKCYIASTYIMIIGNACVGGHHQTVCVFSPLTAGPPPPGHRTPYYIAFAIDTSEAWTPIGIVDLTINCVFMIDVLVNFRTSYPGVGSAKFR